MNDDLEIYDPVSPHRSLEAYHRSREAQANLARAAVNFVRERPGTCLAIGAIALLIMASRRR